MQGRILITATMLGFAAAMWADEAGKPPFDPASARQTVIATPSPYGRLIALDMAGLSGGIDAASTSVRIPPDAPVSADPLAASILLGAVFADNWAAANRSDAERLVAGVNLLEALAAVAGGDGHLPRADRVRALAEEGRWREVIPELGFLHQDTIAGMPDPVATAQLINAAAWVQSARHVVAILEATSRPDLSNILREPLGLGEIVSSLRGATSRIAGNPRVAALVAATSTALPLVSLEGDEPMPADRLAELGNQLEECAAAAFAP